MYNHTQTLCIHIYISLSIYIYMYIINLYIYSIIYTHNIYIYIYIHTWMYAYIEGPEIGSRAARAFCHLISPRVQNKSNPAIPSASLARMSPRARQ